jgi:hypothetical protein
LLNHQTGKHYRCAVTVVRYQPEIMRNQPKCRAVLMNEGHYEFEDLSLNGHVETARRLVSNEQVGLVQKGHRDQNSLCHADAHLMGIRARAPDRIRDPDVSEPLYRAIPGFFPATTDVSAIRIRDLVPDSGGRAESRVWILNNHSNLAATKRRESCC